MDLEITQDNDTYAIKGYRSGQILVNQEFLTRSFVILPDTLIRDWQPQTISEIEIAHFDSIIALEPEIILLGTGTTLEMSAYRLTAHIQSKQIGLEIMDTPACCRCYSVLASEGRRVAAAILMI